jgi:hypothetical protein
MAKKMHIPTAPKTEKPMVLSGLELLLSAGSGHPQPCCRGGAHRDSRFRRQRTRSAQLRAALRD